MRKLDRPQVIAVEAVIGNQQHGRIRTGEVHQPCEEKIHQPVSAVHHVPVEFEIGVAHPVGLRRMVVDKTVAEVVDADVVNGHEIPRLVFHHMSRGGMRREAFGKDLRNRAEHVGFGGVDFTEAGNKGAEHALVDLFRRNAKLPQSVGQTFRPDGARHEIGVRRAARDCIRNARPANRFRRMAPEPAHQVGPQSLLRQNIPQRLHAPGRTGHRAHTSRRPVHFREPQNAVLIGPFPRRNRVPQHR